MFCLSKSLLILSQMVCDSTGVKAMVLLEPEIGAALKHVAASLMDAEFDWWIIGSSALALHGVRGLKISDIDVLVPDPGMAKVASRMLGALPCCKSPSDRFHSDYLAQALVEGIQIDLFGGFKVRTEAGWIGLKPKSCEHISIGDNWLRVPDPDELEDLLKLFSREKDMVRLAELGKQRAS